MVGGRKALIRLRPCDTCGGVCPCVIRGGCAQCAGLPCRPEPCSAALCVLELWPLCAGQSLLLCPCVQTELLLGCSALLVLFLDFKKGESTNNLSKSSRESGDCLISQHRATASCSGSRTARRPRSSILSKQSSITTA